MNGLCRRAVAAVGVGVLCVGVAAAAGDSATAATIVAAPPPATTTTFGGGGDQTDPHLSGDLVVYTSEINGTAQVVIGDVVTGSQTPVPQSGSLDFWPDVRGTTVTYTRVTAESAIHTFDTATGTDTVVDPVAGGSNQRLSRIGDATLAWQDFDPIKGLAAPEIAVYDRTSKAVTRLTNDDMLDKNPAVSPDGGVVVWTKCQQDATGCQIWSATGQAEGGWNPPSQLTTGTGEAEFPHTDGQRIVYSVHSGDDESVFWQPVGGGVAQPIDVPGRQPGDRQTNPNISDGVVTFEQFDPAASGIPNFDVYLYDMATDTVYRLTDTPTDETLNDVEVTGGRQVTVAWTTSGADFNVQASRFMLPALPATIRLAPPSGVGEVDTTHQVTATVLGAAGQPATGTTVRLSVTGSVSADGSCQTDAQGQCSFSYAGPSAPGADDITAFADTDHDGAKDGDEPSAVATWSWQDVTSTPGQSTGAGQIPGPVAFGFTAKSSSGRISGECNVVDARSHTKLHCLDVTRYVQHGDAVRVEGHATLDGVPTTYTIDAQDNGRPGAGVDTFTVTTTGGYRASGTLRAGNVDVHAAS